MASDAEERKDPDEEDNMIDEEKARLGEEADKRKAIVNSEINYRTRERSWAKDRAMHLGRLQPRSYILRNQP
ncbi:hypothetical protein CC80DRAFT_599621, partial [Byssothecium circinans]